MPKRKPQVGDLFQIPVDNDHVAYGQVIASDEDVFFHLVIFDGLHDMNEEPDIEAALGAPVILYLWSRDDCLRDGTWPTVGNATVCPNSIPRVEYVEMERAGVFQVIDLFGNVLRPASRDDIESAPFRSMQKPQTFQDAVKAWHGRAEWSDRYFDLRPWDERAREVDNEGTRLLRRLRE
jgi:Immunity protein 26